MLRIVEPERTIAFYEALEFARRRELPIMRNGELEATNYFLGITGRDELELELTSNHLRPIQPLIEDFPCEP
jgi:hypothetical protein